MADKINSLEVIQFLQEYIDQHIKERMTLNQLARVSGYSPYYVTRLFAKTLGLSPFEYIRKRRLTKAALVIRDENKKVIDVALDFIFDSQEGFTRAFSKEFGISPYQYHIKTPPIKLFLPEGALNSYRSLHMQFDTLENERMDVKMGTVFVQVIEKPERKCIMKRGQKAADYFAYCNEVGCDVWGVLTSVKEALYEPVGMWLPKHMRNGQSEYVQGVEVPLDYDKQLPEGFELITLPAYTVMVFQGEPYEDDEAFAKPIQDIWNHIEHFDPTLYGYQWDAESGPRFQLAPLGCRGYIEGRPVKKIVCQ